MGCVFTNQQNINQADNNTRLSKKQRQNNDPQCRPMSLSVNTVGNYFHVILLANNIRRQNNVK